MALTMMEALEAREEYVNYAVGSLNSRQKDFASRVYAIKDLGEILDRESNLRSKLSAYVPERDRMWMQQILAAQGDYLARMQ